MTFRGAWGDPCDSHAKKSRLFSKFLLTKRLLRVNYALTFTMKVTFFSSAIKRRGV